MPSKNIISKSKIYSYTHDFIKSKNLDYSYKRYYWLENDIFESSIYKHDEMTAFDERIIVYNLNRKNLDTNLYLSTIKNSYRTKLYTDEDKCKNLMVEGIIILNREILDKEI